MRCPKCACQDDKVVDSRSIKDGAGVRRRRECSNCGFRFTTCEEIVPNELKVIKRDGSRENFDRENSAPASKKHAGNAPSLRNRSTLSSTNSYSPLKTITTAKFRPLKSAPARSKRSAISMKSHASVSLPYTRIFRTSTSSSRKSAP